MSFARLSSGRPTTAWLATSQLSEILEIASQRHEVPLTEEMSVSFSARVVCAAASRAHAAEFRRRSFRIGFIRGDTRQQTSSGCPEISVGCGEDTLSASNQRVAKAAR